MNKPIRRVAIACLLMFAALLVNDNVVQFAHAKALRNQPGNTRLLYQQYDRKRGDIVTSTGVTIATSAPTKDTLKYLRTYVNGPLYASVTGFYSIVYNASSIESAENSILSGSDDRLFGVRQLRNLITGRTPQGGSVVLTIDPVLQQAAAKAMAGRKGAVVALDPNTGAILALVSSPSYDPNLLSSHNQASIATTWKQLLADPTNPMLDRALSQTYPPGSTFKLITAAAALSSGAYTPTTMIPAPDALPLPQSTSILRNFHGESCGGSQATLIDALTISCNTAFGGLGLALGQDTLRRQADAFGFDSSFSVPMKSATSVFPVDLSDANTIQSAIGQFDVRATPLQMAMVAASIANGGVEMKPYLVNELVGPDLAVIDQTKPVQLRRAVSSQVAAELSQMMESVVQRGTGTSAQIPGVRVAGKTGTAENATGQPPHAWFVAFAPAVQPKIAIAVVVENGGGNSDATGGAIAAPVAKAVIQAALKERP
jgi:peptidoglycan glycosyltransferase